MATRKTTKDSEKFSVKDSEKVSEKISTKSSTKTTKASAKKETINTIQEEAKQRNINKTAIPHDYEIPVKSNVQGGLVYISKVKGGLEFIWDNTGDVAYIEYGELISMRNSQRQFFENNWIVFEDSDYTAEEVYRALGVDRYYSYTLDNMDDVFDMTESQLQELNSKIVKGLRENIIDRAKALYKENNDIFDSKKKRDMFENIFGFNFEINYED